MKNQKYHTYPIVILPNNIEFCYKNNISILINTNKYQEYDLEKT